MRPFFLPEGANIVLTEVSYYFQLKCIFVTQHKKYPEVMTQSDLSVKKVQRWHPYLKKKILSLDHETR